jgi:hypothetical protein
MHFTKYFTLFLIKIRSQSRIVTALYEKNIYFTLLLIDIGAKYVALYFYVYI